MCSVHAHGSLMEAKSACQLIQSVLLDLLWVSLILNLAIK